MRVQSAHLWPFDPARVEAEYHELGGDLERIDACHRSAWLVVIEIDGPASAFNADEIGYRNEAHLPRANWQAAWLEETLLDTNSRSLVVFFLHEFSPSGQLFYGANELALPHLTLLAPELAERLSYQSP